MLVDSLCINFLATSNVTGIQICASSNQCKVKNTEPSRMIPRKLIANLELSVILCSLVSPKH